MKNLILFYLLIAIQMTSCTPKPDAATSAPEIPKILKPENSLDNAEIIYNDEVIDSKKQIDVISFYNTYMQDDSLYFSKDDQDLIFRANFDNKIIEDIESLNFQNSFNEEEIAKLFITLSTERLINYDFDKITYLEKILSNISQTPFSLEFETISVESNVRKNGLAGSDCILNILGSNFKNPFYEGTLKILVEVYQKCFFSDFNNSISEQEIYDFIYKIKEGYLTYNNPILSDEEKNKIIILDFNNELSMKAVNSVLELQTEYNEEAILKFMIEYSQKNYLENYDPIDLITFNVKMMNSYQLYKEIDMEILNLAFSSEIPSKCIFTQLPNENLVDNNQLDFYNALYTCLKI